MHDYSVFSDRSCDSAQFGYENSIDMETGEIKFDVDRLKFSCSMDSLDLRIAEMEAKKVQLKSQRTKTRGITRQISREKLKQKSDELKRNFVKACDEFNFFLRKLSRNYRFL